MATYTDNFQRSNETLTDSANWSLPSWATESPVISSNNLIGLNESDRRYGMWEGDGTFGREQYSEVTVHLASGPAGRWFGAMVYVSSSNGGYVLTGRTDNGAGSLEKISNTGSHTQLDSIGNSTTGGFADGDVVGIKVEDDGSGNSLITMYKNDSVFETYTDSTSPLTSGQPGVYIGPYSDTEGVSSWEADDFQAAATETVTATVTDASGTALANETGIDWAWTDSFSGSPTDTGTGESTDGSGELVVDVPNTTLSSGQFGYLRVRLSNDDVGIARESID